MHILLFLQYLVHKSPSVRSYLKNFHLFDFHSCIQRTSTQSRLLIGEWLMVALAQDQALFWVLHMQRENSRIRRCAYFILTLIRRLGEHAKLQFVFPCIPINSSFAGQSVTVAARQIKASGGWREEKRARGGESWGKEPVKRYYLSEMFLSLFFLSFFFFLNYKYTSPVQWCLSERVSVCWMSDGNGESESVVFHVNTTEHIRRGNGDDEKWKQLKPPFV